MLHSPNKDLIFYSFIFTSAFPLGRVVGAAALEGLEISHGLQQFLIVLLAPHQNGTKQRRRFNHSTWSMFSISGLLSRGCSQQDLPRHSFMGRFVHMAVETS